jgi:hypothetical protein
MTRQTITRSLAQIDHLLSLGSKQTRDGGIGQWQMLPQHSKLVVVLLALSYAFAHVIAQRYRRPHTRELLLRYVHHGTDSTDAYNAINPKQFQLTVGGRKVQQVR